MIDGYGTSRWTCGQCGEVFESSGIVGDSRVMRWRDEHKAEHRRDAMSPEQRAEYDRRRVEAAIAVFSGRSSRADITWTPDA